MAKFNVGDKVRVLPHDWVSFDMEKQIGKIGTITFDDGSGHMQYRLDIGQARAPWHENCFELAQPRREFIVIRRSGAETIAELRHDREVIKSAKATCAPSDTFDLDTGAKLAFDRLMGREEQSSLSPADIFFAFTGRPAPEPTKFYTGKVVCYGCEAGTEWVYGALIGKIGTIKNGHATWRSGLGCEGYTSFDDFCARNKSGRWLEIKE